MAELGQRELLAIIFTDAVGSTIRTAMDEDRSLSLLLSDLDFIRNEAHIRGGVVLKNTGDGLLISFKSAVDAIECALSVQKTLTQSPTEQAFLHKIGVHIGDVIKKDGDIYGNGVNTASRLVDQCDPGGICVSSTILELTKQKSEIGKLEKEEFLLENIDPPIRAHKIRSLQIGKVRNMIFNMRKKTKMRIVKSLTLVCFLAVLALSVSQYKKRILAALNPRYENSFLQGNYPSINLSGVWTCDQNSEPKALFYLTQVGATVFWYGEEKADAPTWSHMAVFEIKDGLLYGKYSDTPKGKLHSYGSVKIKVMNEDKLSTVEASGGWPIGESFSKVSH